MLVRRPDLVLLEWSIHQHQSNDCLTFPGRRCQSPEQHGATTPGDSVMATHVLPIGHSGFMVISFVV